MTRANRLWLIAQPPTGRGVMIHIPFDSIMFSIMTLPMRIFRFDYAVFFLASYYMQKRNKLSEIQQDQEGSQVLVPRTLTSVTETPR